jgi:hypothetical protein
MRSVLTRAVHRLLATSSGGTSVRSLSLGTRLLVSSLSLSALAASLSVMPSCSSESDEPSEDGKNVDRIVYAVRQHTVEGEDGVSIDVAGGMGQVMDYKRYVPGGRLEVLDLRTGDVANIVKDYPTADVASIDVSYDATKVVFSMKTSAEDNYHLYWASLSADDDGKFEIHQLTFGPYDDLHAIWLPGDRIAFITEQPYTDMGTRADEYNHARIVTQIGTISLSGGDSDRKLCSQNLSHTINLFSLSDGRVGFSRWEHLENVNDVKLFSMNPDCTQMTAIAGQHGKPANSIVQIQETSTPRVFIGIGTERENTIQAGALVRVDAAGDGSNNEELASFDVITPSVPREDDPSPIGRYRSPALLPDGRILTSWADGTVNDLNELALTPPDFGIYVYDSESRTNQLVKNYADSWELYARPIVKRVEPTPIGSIQNSQDTNKPVTLGSVNVHQTSLGSLHGETVSGAQFGDGVSIDEALKDAVKVRIIEGFSSEGAPGVTMFGLTMAEGGALLGEATVYEDGSWSADIPPFLPVHLQVVDQYDLSIRNQTTWIQGMPGESRACGGCHEERSKPFSPAEQQLTIAAGKGPQDFVQPVAERTEYPWAYAKDAENDNEIQKILDARCTSCHNETTNGDGPQTFYSVSMTDAATGTATSYQIPRLDLTAHPITVHYDRETKPWPASYVSIFYPAALQMEMAMGVEVEGEIPPSWGIPSDARHSAMIEKLNITSASDDTKYAWPLGEAFSAEGIAGGTRTDHAAVAGLTRDELVKLIRAIDLGGQFYARQNTEFSPYTSGPVQEY